MHYKKSHSYKNARSTPFGPFQQSKKAKLKERHEKWIVSTYYIHRVAVLIHTSLYCFGTDYYGWLELEAIYEAKQNNETKVKTKKKKKKEEPNIIVDLSSFNEILSSVPDNTSADAKSKNAEVNKNLNSKGNKAGKRAAYVSYFHKSF